MISDLETEDSATDVLKAFLDLLFSVTRRTKSETDLSTIIARQIHIVLGNLNETQLVT